MSNGVEDTGTQALDHWPQFRRMVDGRHYYNVLSPGHFLELQAVGRRWVLHEVLATAYPEMLRVQEMLQCLEGRYEAVSEDDWMERFEQVG